MRNQPDRHQLVVSSEALRKLGLDTAAPEPLPPFVESTAPFVSARVVSALARVGEALLAMAVGAMTWLIFRGWETAAFSSLYFATIGAVGLVLPLVLQAAGLYSIHALLRTVDHVSKLAVAWTTIFASIAAAVFFTKAGDEFSRLWLASWFAAGLCALAYSRFALSALVRRWNANGQLARRAVLIGGGNPASTLIEALRASETTDITLSGIFDDRAEARSPASVAGLRKLGDLGDLIDFVRRCRVDLLLITFPITAESRLLEILKRLWVLPVDIRLSAHTQKLRYRPRAYSYVGNVPFLDLSDKPLSDWSLIVKAMEDKIIAALVLVLVSPILLLVALAVKLDSRGPVLFRQRRFGFNNELIEVLKFRSMHAQMCDAKAEKLVTARDPRVTRVGRIIRKLSLDELPQLVNVLRGELSLVGPRPHAERAKAADRLYTDVVEGYFARHKVKPGITGWAQINGWRGETDTADKIQRRVEHDLYYIENWSLAFDLYILLRTPFALLDTECAY